MEERQQYPENDPRHHTIKIKKMLDDTINHARKDISKIEDPRGKALMDMPLR